MCSWYSMLIEPRYFVLSIFKVLHAHRTKVRAVTDGIQDTDGNSAKPLQPLVTALIDRFPSVKVTDYRVWQAASHHYSACGDEKKAQDCRRNAHRDVKLIPAWEKNILSLEHVIETAIDVVNGYVTLAVEADMGGARMLVR